MPVTFPKMILFDFGETIMKCEKDTFSEATKKVLELSVNPEGITAEELQTLAERIRRDLVSNYRQCMLEGSFQSYLRFLFEYYGLRLPLTGAGLERLFWDTAYEWKPTPGIETLLKFMEKSGIRKGIVSNTMFTGETLRYELNKHFPEDTFEFVIASVDYYFRKPSAYLFELALRKAGLPCSEVWFAGDMHEFDVMGAFSCKLQPIWYNTCGLTPVSQECSADYCEVLDWTGLVELLQGLRT